MADRTTPRTITVLGITLQLAKGEHYAGLILNADGTPMHHLVLLPGDNDGASWAAQTAWAESLGGDLPTRPEQALLYANCKAQFKADWYWSNTQHAEDSDYAWSQGFYGGYQLSLNESAQLRARAVRRLPI